MEIMKKLENLKQTPVENIDQIHQSPVKDDGNSSSQETAEASKCKESCSQVNNKTEEDEEEEYTLESRPIEDLLMDLIWCGRDAVKHKQWNVVLRVIQTEAKLRGWLGNKVQQKPTKSSGA